MPIDPVKNVVLPTTLVDKIKADRLAIRCSNGLLEGINVAHPEYDLRGKLAEAFREPQVIASVEAECQSLSDAANRAAEQTLLELLARLPKQEFEN